MNACKIQHVANAQFSFREQLMSLNISGLPTAATSLHFATISWGIATKFCNKVHQSDFEIWGFFFFFNYLLHNF